MDEQLREKTMRRICTGLLAHVDAGTVSYTHLNPGFRCKWNLGSGSDRMDFS